MSVERNCLNCGETFSTNAGRRKKYCSPLCAQVASRGQPSPSKGKHRVPMGQHTCPVCGSLFERYAKDSAKYCSRRCSGKVIGPRNTGRPVVPVITRTCEQCGIVFQTKEQRLRRFCSPRCWTAWQSANLRGERNALKGRPTGRPAWNKQPRYEYLCGWCGRTFVAKENGHPNRFCTKACSTEWNAERQRRYALGERDDDRNPFYGASWRSALRAIRLRDAVCQRCGKTPAQNKRQLDVHHLVPFRLFGEGRHLDANDPRNLVALCRACHKVVEWEQSRASTIA